MKDSFFGLDEAGLHDENVELLTTVHDGVELMVLRSILEGEKIPYMTKDRGSGSAVRLIAGYTMNVAATDVYVPKAAAERAKEILEAYRSAEPVEEEIEGAGDGSDLTPEEEP